MRSATKILVLSALCLVTPWNSVEPQEKKTLQVLVSDFAPCVVKQRDGSVTGFEIAIWKAVARDLKLDYKFKVVKFSKLWQEIANKRCDAALAGLTVTSKREAQADFSHPYLNAGMSIVARAGSSSSFIPLLPALIRITWMTLYFSLFLVFVGHLFWLLEKGNPGVDDHYIPGVFEAIWFSFQTSATVTFGDYSPSRWGSRILCVVMMFSGIAFFGYIISQLTATITTTQLTRAFQHKELSGSIVGTRRGTTSEQLLKTLGATPVSFESIEQAFEKVASGELKLALFDTPATLHYLKTKGRGRLEIVGQEFRHRPMAIAFPAGSPLREKVNHALLRLIESGEFERIRKHWIGDRR